MLTLKHFNDRSKSTVDKLHAQTVQRQNLHQFGLLTLFCMKQPELTVSFPITQQFTDTSIASKGVWRQRWCL